MTDESGADPQAPPADASQPSKDERLWATLAHLGGLVFFIPLGNIIAPLVIWLIKREEMPFVDDQARESLNFQITITIAAIVLGLLTCLLLGVGAYAVMIYDVVLVIIAAIKANEGVPYRYPLTIRLIK